MPKPEKTDKALSDAARAVVREPGDPRIDAHLAALGLGPDDESPARPQPAAAEDEAAKRLAAANAQLADVSAQVAAASAQLADVSARLGAERGRVRSLAIALVIAVGLDIVLLVARFGG